MKPITATGQILIRKHNFKEITTTKYYPGTHYLSLMINGVEYKRVDFQLIT